ncbi:MULTISPECIES: hypothetical protein [Paenibacillus]|jgi:hypothetical protein|uniref:Uncharacterized protein n=1 Tax=Paenibacillus oceani TaxID=2772510 RepID=A0A927CH63_9BACL|nr:hypothetical protein [Paenibacillus oceani]MBD2866527.1 hypothetical protein [Paenibacillus oceani]MDF2662273.1 hypothetical protein [Paenibacillus sp.]
MEQRPNDVQNNPVPANDPHLTGASYMPPAQPLKHSGLGIASFIISVTMLGAIILSFVVMTSLAADLITGGGLPDEQMLLEKSPILILFVFLILGALVLDIVGGVLGIVSLFQKERKKVFGILGTIFCFLPIVGFFLLFLIGLVLSGQAV